MSSEKHSHSSQRMTIPSEDQVPVSLVLTEGRQVTLRFAGPEDARDLVEIQKQIVHENVANVDDHVDTFEECRARVLRTQPGNMWLVADAGGLVVGSMRLVEPGPNFLKHIRNLFIEIHHDWRGLGIGEAMIAAGAAWAVRNGVEMIALSVLASNPRARSLYERLGFIVTGHTPALVKRPDGSYADDTQMVWRFQATTTLMRADGAPFPHPLPAPSLQSMSKGESNIPAMLFETKSTTERAVAHTKPMVR